MQVEKVSFSFHRHVAMSFFLAGAIGTTSIAFASDGDWSRPKFEYIAHKKNIRDLLREFSKDQGLGIEIGEGVDGTVSGEFNSEPRKVLDVLAENYGFTWRVEGSILHISSVQPSANASIQLRLSTFDQLRATLNTLTAKNGNGGPGEKANLSDSTSGNSSEIGKSGVPERVNSTWTVQEEDRTLSTALERWARQAGWKLLWESTLDYSIEASATINGTFEDAIEFVAKNLANSENPMRASFYKGNKVVRIFTKGVQ